MATSAAPAPQPEPKPTPSKSNVARAWIWAGLVVMLGSQSIRYQFSGLSYPEWQATSWYVLAQIGFWAGWALFVTGAVIRWRKVTRPALAAMSEEQRRKRYRRMAIVAVAVLALATLPLAMFLLTSPPH
jgi:hypothetical protein